MSEERTLRWLAAFAEANFAKMESLLDPDVTLVNLMTLDGTQDAGTGHVGREAVLGYFRRVHELLPHRRLRDLRVTTADDTVFLQFNGDFRTAGGRPYRNVHVLRLDWRYELLVSVEEYANPITFNVAFPELSPSAASPSAARP